MSLIAKSNFNLPKICRVYESTRVLISKELKNANHCAVYEPELTRVWPDPDKREMQIASFAKKHGWRLRYYSHGFCAIFDKAPLHEAAGWRF
jgi:hypothetical protein